MFDNITKNVNDSRAIDTILDNLKIHKAQISNDHLNQKYLFFEFVYLPF